MRVASAADVPGDVPGGGQQWRTEHVRLHGGNLLVRHRPGRRPPVIFEAGLGLPGSLWHAVCDLLPGDRALLCYDRAGLGGSDPGPLPRCGARQARELHELLGRLALAPPYVLVGHSAGAFVVRLFAASHPDEVSGLVLVDPSEEDEPAQPPAVDLLTNGGLRALAVLARAPGRGALLAPAERIAAAARGDLATRWRWLLRELSTAEHLTGLLRENQAYPLTVAQMKAAGGAQAMPGLPVRLITAVDGSRTGGPGEARRDRRLGLDSALAAASPEGQHLLAPGAGHLIPLTAPQLVADAVLGVL